MADAEENVNNQNNQNANIENMIEGNAIEVEEAIEAIEEFGNDQQQNPIPQRQMNNLELINAVIAPVPNLSPREQIHFLNEIFRYDDDDTSENTIECDCSDCEDERQAIERATISLDSDNDDCDCTSCLSNCGCVSCIAEDRYISGSGAPVCMKFLKKVDELKAKHTEQILSLQQQQQKLQQPKPSTSTTSSAVEVQN